jgi:hypothetical protein
MRTISMICYNRPKYLARALAAIDACDTTGFDELHIFAEPVAADTEMASLLRSLTTVCGRIPVTVHMNEKKLGVRDNPYRALSFVFECLGSDLNVHVEDDVLISPDALQMAIWYQSLPHRVKCMCLCLFNPGGSWDETKLQDEKQCVSCYGFSPWGWACTKENWQEWFSREWYTDRWAGPNGERVGWDWSINYHTAFTHTASTVMPAVSRAMTIGAEGGIHSTPEAWARDFGKHVIFPGRTKGFYLL